MPSDSNLKLIYTTHSHQKEAEVLAENLVRQGLIACANIFPSGKSIYMWNQGLQTDEEVIAILKTTDDRLEALEASYLKLHPYDTPCFVVLDTQSASTKYLAWAQEQTKH